MNNSSIQSISPESLAGKFAGANLTDIEFAEALHNDGRLSELLWFLQWISYQPGGLCGYAISTVEASAPSFGPAWLHDPEAKPSIEQRLAAWNLLPEDRKRELIPKNLWTEREDEVTRHFKWLYPTPQEDAERKKFHTALSSLSVNKLAAVFTDQTKREIPGIIRSMCDKSVLWKRRTCWFCNDIIEVMLESMELYAARALQQIARTKLADVVFDNLDYACSERRVVKMDGNPRTGKSESVFAWTNGCPGRARLVVIPPGISMRDLLSAIAESLGIVSGPQTSVQKLKDSVQFVIRHCGLMIVADEAHNLMPGVTSQAAAPARLDWFRSHVIDRRVGCALVCTPQNWRNSQARLEKTGYIFQQVVGRIDLTVPLPEETPIDDLDAVVEAHSAGIPKELHRFIALKISANEDYLSRVEAVCCRTRFLARKNGRTVCRADVEQAVLDVIPSSAPKAKPTARQHEMGTVVPISPRTRKLTPALESPQRETSPPNLTVNH